jgi:hypothetical protein
LLTAAGDRLLFLWRELVNNASFSISSETLIFAMAECVSKLIFVSSNNANCNISVIDGLTVPGSNVPSRAGARDAAAGGGGASGSLLEQFILYAEGVVFSPDEQPGTVNPVGSGRTRGTIATTALVLLKQSCDRSRVNRNFNFFTFLQLDRLCVVFLQLLGTLQKLTADSDPLVQVNLRCKLVE